MENKDSFKVEGMTILLETDDGEIVYFTSRLLHSDPLPDLNRLRRGTSSEWEED